MVLVSAGYGAVEGGVALIGMGDPVDRGDRVCKMVRCLQRSVLVEAAAGHPSVYRVEHVLGRVLGAASQQGRGAVAAGDG